MSSPPQTSVLDVNYRPLHMRKAAGTNTKRVGVPDVCVGKHELSTEEHFQKGLNFCRWNKQVGQRPLRWSLTLSGSVSAFTCRLYVKHIQCQYHIQWVDTHTVYTFTQVFSQTIDCGAAVEPWQNHLFLQKAAQQEPTNMHSHTQSYLHTYTHK